MIRKRARFSTFFWPSLYSPRTILAIPIILLLIGGLFALLMALNRQLDRNQITRVDERVRAILALKLSGVPTWQWKKEIACQNLVGDCLIARLSFTPPVNHADFIRKVKIPTACNICHAREPIAKSQQEFFVSFPEVIAVRENFVVEFVIIGILGSSGLGIALYLMLLRRKRLQDGVCVAAISWNGTTDLPIQKLIATLETSVHLAYYAENDGKRLRWATTEKKLLTWLNENELTLNKYRTSLRIVALHTDLTRNPILPIETLRSIYQFLAQTPIGMYLLQDKLLEHQDQNTINMRRLVFKNKSGASLKFVAWEAT